MSKPTGSSTIVVSGVLDAAAGATLASEWRAALAQRPSGLTLDLSGIDAATPEGVRSVAACLASGRRSLSGGVDVAVANAVGRDVLLAIFAQM